MGRLLVLGISGPTASGKGLARKTLKLLDPRAHIFEADRAAHHAYRKGSSLAKKLVSHFGNKIRKKGGGIDRDKLGEIVFSNPKALRYLNSLTHSKIRLSLKDAISQARQRDVPLLIVDAALLHTISLHRFVDTCWVIQSKESLRVLRLLRSRKMTRQQARTRIRVQRGIRFQCARDRVIHNNGTKGEFIRKVRRAYNDLLRHGRI